MTPRAATITILLMLAATTARSEFTPRGTEDRVTVASDQAGLTPVQSAILRLATVGSSLWDEVGQPVEVSLAGGSFMMGTNAPSYSLPRVVPPIAKIAIRDGAQTTDVTLAVLRAFPKLTDLSLPSARVTDAGLTQLNALTQLTRLDLSYTAVTDQGLAALMELRRLRELQLKNTQITTYRPLANFPEITALNLESTKVGDEEIGILRDLPKLATLQLRGTRVTAAGLRVLAGKSSLVELSFTGGRLTEALVDLLRTFPNLQHLDLAIHGRLDQAAMQRLRELSCLRSLVLGGNSDLNDDRLAGLAELPGLTVLWIPHTPVTDAGLAHLSGLKSLADLGLDGTAVSDAGLAQLAKIKSLKNIWLWSTQVTQTGVHEFRRQRPDIHVACPDGW